jgi:hypothetical protein
MDEGDSKKQIKNSKDEGEPYSIMERCIANVGNVFSPIWIRRTFQIDDGGNWLILGRRYNFLFNFRMFLVLLYLFFQINQ